MSELSADNLTVKVTDDGQIVHEVGYVGFLRENDYTIESVVESHTVPSEGRDMGHMVMKVKTYDYAKSDPQLDYAQHEVDIWTCDCWNFRREHSADVTEGERPSDSGVCKHIRKVSKVERAENDKHQDTLTDE